MGSGRHAMDSTALKIQDLDALGAALRHSIGSPAVFDCLNTRLIIQIGVNLKDVAPEQAGDPELLRRVAGALGRMGIRVEVEEA
ncbi:MAG: hypothetical protein IT372_32965 [Polyangiaceae bacterium]|nr:hypothetical protein [Polyangiaceae bacterium]